MQPRYISAIEIGSSQIKGAVASVDPETGRITVVAREQVHASGCVRYGWINNVEEAGRLIEQIIDRLESNPRVAPARIRATYVAIAGRSLRASAHDVTLRLDDERKITADTLARLAKDARESFVTDNEIVEVSPRHFVIDSGAIANPIGAYSRTLSATYNVVTCRPQMLRNVNRVFDSLRSRLHVAGIVILPLAEADLVLSNDECRVGCAMVDVGSDTTSVVVYKDDELRYLATIPMGSHHITRDLTSLGITLEKAEAYKLNNGHALGHSQSVDGMESDRQYDVEADNILSARIEEIVANIVANIGYSNLTPGDLPRGIVMVGGGSYLRGFDELLRQESGMSVRRGRPDDRMRLEATPAIAERSVDILATLMAASHINTGVQCLEQPAPAAPRQTEEQEIHNQDARRYGGYAIDGPDDPGLLDDDPDDPAVSDLFEREEPVKKEEKPRPKRKLGLMERLARRAGDLMKGPDEE